MGGARDQCYDACLPQGVLTPCPWHLKEPPPTLMSLMSGVEYHYGHGHSHFHLANYYDFMSGTSVFFVFAVSEDEQSLSGDEEEVDESA